MAEYSSLSDIANLKTAFRASSLATPIKGATTVDFNESSLAALTRLETRGYDQAPAKRGKKTVGWVLTDRLRNAQTVAECLEPIEDSVMVSKETSLSNAIKRLNEVPFIFTVSESGVDAFICRSDLERHIVRAYFNLLTSQIEILLGFLVKRGVDEDIVAAAISKRNTHQEGRSLYEKFQNSKSKNQETHPVEYLYLEQLVDLMSQIRPKIAPLLLKQLKTKLKIVVANRNQFAHNTRRLSATQELKNLDEAFEYLLGELISLAEEREPSSASD